MAYLKPSKRPRELLEELATPEQPARSRLYREGFEHFFEQLPVIDAKNPDQRVEVAETKEVLDTLAHEVTRRLDTLSLPDIPDREFGRVILGIEDPKTIDGALHPGTEVVLALWGKGFSSPVHGHAPGYIHEALLRGAFDVFIYKPTGEPSDRLAVRNQVIRQHTPGIFYSEFVQDHGQERRSALVHNFTAREPNTMSLHYLPEHVRDGNANRFAAIGRVDIGTFAVETTDVRRVTPGEAMQSSVGAVYLVRSPNIPQHGDHYILITGGLVQKSHGLRPKDAVFPAPIDGALNQYGTEELVLLKLNDRARAGFYEHFGIVPELRNGGLGIPATLEREGMR